VIGHDGPVHDEASAEADPTLDAAQEQAPEAVAPPSARLLADFLSAEKDRVLAAMWAVYATRDDEILLPLARQVSQIRRATADIDLGGIVASHRSNLEHALDRLTLAGSGRCLCGAYPSHAMYNPVKEEAKQHVRIVGTEPNPRQWEADRICECCDCGRRFQVEQGEYHDTWWGWRPIHAEPGRARR